ncbi:MAG: outer membrane protein [Vicinamibacterales bacterium]
MARVHFVILALIAITAAAPARAQAQGPWTLEVRAGGSVPTGSFAGTDLEAGVGFEGSLGYRFAPGLSLFGGWDWQHRQAEDPLFGRAEDVEDTGYVYGLRFVTPGSATAKPFLRVAGLWNHVELEDEEGELVADSEHTWGFEVGGGLDVSLSESWSLTPGVRYRRFEPAVRFGAAETEARLSYVTFDVGFAWRF